MVAGGGTRLAGGSRAALERAMRQTPMLADTPAGSVQALAEQGTVREYRRGTYLFHQHDEAPTVYFLWRGGGGGSPPPGAGGPQLHTTPQPPPFFCEARGPRGE